MSFGRTLSSLIVEGPWLGGAAPPAGAAGATGELATGLTGAGAAAAIAATGAVSGTAESIELMTSFMGVESRTAVGTK
tara:strand:- start:924 stop:1157 length:234 start_codon:yes stop_codon:yes gene_type:complete